MILPSSYVQNLRLGGFPEDLGNGQYPRDGVWKERIVKLTLLILPDTLVKCRGSVRSKATWTWVTSMLEAGEHWRKDHNHSGYHWLLSRKHEATFWDSPSGIDQCVEFMVSLLIDMVMKE